MFVFSFHTKLTYFVFGMSLRNICIKQYYFLKHILVNFILFIYLRIRNCCVLCKLKSERSSLQLRWLDKSKYTSVMQHEQIKWTTIEKKNWTLKLLSRCLQYLIAIFGIILKEVSIFKFNYEVTKFPLATQLPRKDKVNMHDDCLLENGPSGRVYFAKSWRNHVSYKKMKLPRMNIWRWNKYNVFILFVLFCLHVTHPN